MRIHAAIVLVSLVTVGVMYPWNWHNLEEQIRLRVFHLEAKESVVSRMTDDLAELLADHPNLERLYARAYVARALSSCDFAFLAGPEEVQDFSTAIRLDPGYARAYLYRGLAENGVEQDIADLSTAIQLDPKGKLAELSYSNLAARYERSLQPEKAIAVYDRAILKLSSLPLSSQSIMGCYNCRARLYGMLGQQQRKQEDLTKARGLTGKADWEYRWSVLKFQFGRITRFVIMLLPLWIVRRFRGLVLPT